MERDENPVIEMANGDALPTDMPAATGHPGEHLEQPIPADPIPVRDPADTAAPAPKRTVEQWATDKGMLPQFREGKKAPAAPAKAKPPLVPNPAFAAYAAAKASLRWPIGMELTEAEFDEAIALQDGPPVDGVTAHIYR